MGMATASSEREAPLINGVTLIRMYALYIRLCLLAYVQLTRPFKNDRMLEKKYCDPFLPSMSRDWRQVMLSRSCEALPV
jgi:hypothetical protein